MLINVKRTGNELEGRFCLRVNWHFVGNFVSHCSYCIYFYRPFGLWLWLWWNWLYQVSQKQYGEEQDKIWPFDSYIVTKSLCRGLVEIDILRVISKRWVHKYPFTIYYNILVWLLQLLSISIFSRSPAVDGCLLFTHISW